MRPGLLPCFILSITFFAANPVMGGCATSDRTSPLRVTDGIKLVGSGLSSGLTNAMRSAYTAWNDCNQGNSSFPYFSESAGLRTITVEYVAGTHPTNSTVCGGFAGNTIQIFETAYVNGTPVPCTRADIAVDVIAHEIGHALGLTHSSCPDMIMDIIRMPGGTYRNRSLSTEECNKANEVNETQTEAWDAYCLQYPNDPDCNPDRCEPPDLCQGSPIVIDVRGDDFLFTSLEEGVVFDLDADGLPDRTAWTAPGGRDAFLVLDRNANGRIDHGRELFGSHTPLLDGTSADHGYSALIELEYAWGDGNGVIDRRDSIYWLLEIWRDRNHDGQTQPGELWPLQRIGLVSLQVWYTISPETDAHGNRLRFQSTGVRRLPSGELRVIRTVDVFFKAQTILSD